MAHVNRKLTLDDIWPELEAGVVVLITDLNAGMSRGNWMQLYSHVYNYCATSRPTHVRAGQKSTGGAVFVGEELYLRLVELLKRHMKTLQKIADSRMDESLLQYYDKEWERFTTAMGYVSHIFQYLNRHWIKREADDGKKEVYEVYVLSLVIWRDNLFMPLKGRLTKALLQLIERERVGEQVDHRLLKSVIQSYVSLGLNKEKPKEPTLGVYQNFFEDEFLLATEVFYTTEASHFIASNSVSDYLKKVEQRLNDETDRVKNYLHSNSLADLMSKCERVLIEKHTETIWNEFQSMLQDDKVEDLTRMYSLLSRVERGLDPLRSGLERHVQFVGEQAVAAAGEAALTDPKLYVETLLKVWRKYSELVQTAFKGDAGFVSALDKASRRFINDNAVCKAASSASKSPELLARFCDLLLKKSAKNPEEDEMDKTLSDVMIAFKYLEDKDVFQTFYSKQLAKRLIHGMSASEDLEALMISKLKATCGYEYTSKLQRMFSDMQLSRDLLDRFNTYLEEREKGVSLGVDLSVLILATGSWPLQPAVTPFTVPKDLQLCEELFVKFYTNQHSGRKLSWLHQLSKGEVKARLGPRLYTFQCSTYQIGILLAFNNQDIITVEDMQTATQLSESALQQTLLSLLKTKVLQVDSGGSESDLNRATRLSVNVDFRSKRQRVNINVPIREQEKKATDDTMQAVEEDRKLQVQAAIVRIMKARKRLLYTLLVTEVITQLQSRFVARPPLIKKSIDLLIEKEYLERVEGNKDMLSYVA